MGRGGGEGCWWGDIEGGKGNGTNRDQWVNPYCFYFCRGWKGEWQRKENEKDNRKENKKRMKKTRLTERGEEQPN